MIIHNATFIIERHLEDKFIAWFRTQLPELGPLQIPRLSTMREAGGVDCSKAEAQSVAFQCEFESEEKALDWRSRYLNPLVGRFSKIFGNEAMVFTSLFSQIPLE